MRAHTRVGRPRWLNHDFQEAFGLSSARLFGSDRAAHKLAQFWRIQKSIARPAHLAQVVWLVLRSTKQSTARADNQEE